MNFDINFELEIAREVCNAGFENQVVNENFEISFFLVAHSAVQIKKAEINTIKSDFYNLKGFYSYVVTGEYGFHPTLVIMIQPIFQNKTECNNKKTYTYFVNLRDLKTQKRGEIVMDIGKITLIDNYLITVDQSNAGEITKNSDFKKEDFEYIFRYGMEYWYKL